MCFPEFINAPLLSLTSFAGVTSRDHRPRTYPSHASASLCTVLLSTLGRSLPQHFESQPEFFDWLVKFTFFPRTCWTCVSYSVTWWPCEMKQLRQATEWRAVLLTPLIDGACNHVAFVSCRSSARRGCQKFSQPHVTTKWFPSLPPSFSLCWASVLWFLPQLSSLFVVPSLFLTVDALDVLMLFIVRWQSILHRCFFLNI